uniref:RING-type E3 ubiquitin transferase n=2 Tax=Kalanchoe fedtschenkoi TaxID=63787 RepID=A0A7N0UWP6_KALFE
MKLRLPQPQWRDCSATLTQIDACFSSPSHPVANLTFLASHQSIHDTDLTMCNLFACQGYFHQGLLDHSTLTAMKFGDTFTKYLRHKEHFLDQFTHVEYKRLKKVLKRCRACRALHDPSDANQKSEDGNEGGLCPLNDCSLCDQKFFSELMEETSSIAGCFSARVRHLLNLHVATGMQRYVLLMRQCFKKDQQLMVEEGRLLIEYITMNATAIRKILKKYDKVHRSVNGQNFKSKLRAERIELLQSPWLIELGAFYLNFTGSDNEGCEDLFSCRLDSEQPVLILRLPDSVEIEYELSCAVCLDTIFNPYALSCGHRFCKACACSAASVMIFEGLKAASAESKCPVCREAGVYNKAVHLLELDFLIKKRHRKYWKERQADERSEMTKQSKDYWELQTKYVIGY